MSRKFSAKFSATKMFFCHFFCQAHEQLCTAANKNDQKFAFSEHVRTTTDTKCIIRILLPLPSCATKIDIAPKNPGISTVPGLFRAPFFEVNFLDIRWMLEGFELSRPGFSRVFRADFTGFSVKSALFLLPCLLNFRV